MLMKLPSERTGTGILRSSTTRMIFKEKKTSLLVHKCIYTFYRGIQPVHKLLRHNVDEEQ